MSYSLNLGEDGRILSATRPEYLPGGVVVESLPEGDISEYRMVDGAFVHDPLPAEETAEEPTVGELKEQIDTLTECLLEMSEIVYA